jgi:predicted ATPase
MTLGAPMMATRGYAAPEVGRVYARARELCEQIGESPQLMPVMLGLRNFYQVRGEFNTAGELGEQAVTLAQRLQDDAFLAHAHFSLGHTLFSLGKFVQARERVEQGAAFYAAQQHRSYAFSYGQDPGVFCLSTLAWSLWYLGYPVQALERVQESLALAQQISHLPSLEHALTSTAIVRQLRLEASEAQTQAEASLAISQEQGFAMRLAVGNILRGWSLVMQGQAPEGIHQMTQGIDSYRATGAEAWCHYWLALLADVYGTAGQIEEEITSLDEALTLVEKNGECYYETEIYRLKGQLLLQQSSDNSEEAESCFQQAITIAQNQSAKSWELRAATSLARLWQSQGKVAEARELLEPVYSWFTEGFDTADLIEAKTLLDELA